MKVLPAQYQAPSSTPLTAAPRLPLSEAQQLAHASQNSISSNESGYSFALQENSSDHSELTNLTELSSAASNVSRQQELQKAQTSMQQRACTPDDTSPISVTSPVFSNGTKRTASGHVKNAQSYSDTYNTFTPGRTRAESMSSTGSRVGELAASLKTRLGYAMTKVQHGWEHKTIGELERLTTNKPLSNGNGNHAVNPRTAEGYHGLDNALSPPSKRRSGMFSTPLTDTHASHPTGPQLQPAVHIHSRQHSRSADLRHVSGASMNAIAMSPPQTPVARLARRPPTIRTDTQTAEAERDALQALTQLGSPHNSQYSRHHNASQGNSSQASPSRTDFAPARRVSFARGESDSSILETSSEEGRARVQS